MRSPAFAVLLLIPALIHADDGPDGNPGSAARPEKKREEEKRQLTLAELKEFFADEKGRITTGWIDNDLRQEVFEAFTKAGYMQVLGEAKMGEDGKTVYRKGFKSLTDAYPDAVKMVQHCKTALTETTFQREDQEMHWRGYFLMQSQTFVDREGAVLISASWLKYASDSN